MNQVWGIRVDFLARNCPYICSWSLPSMTMTQFMCYDCQRAPASAESQLN